MKVRKFLSIILVIAALFSLSACSASKKADNVLGLIQKIAAIEEYEATSTVSFIAEKSNADLDAYGDYLYQWFNKSLEASLEESDTAEFGTIAQSRMYVQQSNGKMTAAEMSMATKNESANIILINDSVYIDISNFDDLGLGASVDSSQYQYVVMPLDSIDTSGLILTIGDEDIETLYEKDTKISSKKSLNGVKYTVKRSMDSIEDEWSKIGIQSDKSPKELDAAQEWVYAKKGSDYEISIRYRIANVVLERVISITPRDVEIGAPAADTVLDISSLISNGMLYGPDAGLSLPEANIDPEASDGYNDGYQYGYSAGYTSGYYTGQNSSSYDDTFDTSWFSYEDDFDSGYSAGYTVGYPNGYFAGFNGYDFNDNI